MIVEKKGDLLTSGCDVICHQVNCKGVMGAGLAKQIKVKYPEAFAEYAKWCKEGGSSLLGQAQFILCHDGTVVANLFGQDGYGRGGVYTDMAALAKCLDAVKRHARQTGRTVGFPKYLGAGLAGGDWNAIYQLILDRFSGPETDAVIVEWEV